jgi:hypothetical protein
VLPEHLGPVFRGGAVNGIDYVCGECSAIIAERVTPGQFVEFGVVCAHCETLVSFPDLPAGRPLPRRKTVPLPNRLHRWNTTINSGDDVFVAGEDALRRHFREVGLSENGQPPGAPQTPLDEALLRQMVADARTLLGDRYQRRAERHARGKASATPPTDPHRLLELIDAANTAADSFAANTPMIDAVSTAELHTALWSFERWRNIPCWQSIVASLSNPSDYLHSVVLLVAASYLTDVGNGVELVDAPGDERMADMRVHPTAKEIVNTEVKTPRSLIRPDAPLTLDRARKVVQKQMSSASTSEGGQLDPGHPGLLILGGFGLREEDFDVLQLAATDELRRRRGTGGHVMGIALVSVGAEVENRPAVAGGGGSLSGTARIEIVLNEGYDGAIAIDTSGPPGPESPPGQQQVSEPNEKKKVGRNEPCWCGSGEKFKRCHGA